MIIPAHNEERHLPAKLANLAALELHVPQWTVGPDATQNAPDLLVFEVSQVSAVGWCWLALVRDGSGTMRAPRSGREHREHE